MEVYETVKSIGSGSFGQVTIASNAFLKLRFLQYQVYLVKHKREDKLYVIKKVKTRDMNPKDRENTEQEVTTEIGCLIDFSMKC